MNAKVMKQTATAFCILAISAANALGASAPITRVALFKNGVAAVLRTGVNLGPECLITDEIRAIHGTLWFSDMEELTARTERDVLHISRTGKSAAKPLFINYLTKGAAWAPSYKITLGPEGKARLVMNCVIFNELENWRDVEVSLISGFPNIRFENTLTPLAKGMNISTFFAQLNGMDNYQNNISGYRAKRAPDILNQVMPAVGFSAGGESIGAPTLAPSGESEDIHLRDIGKIDLDGGERLYLPLENSEVDYTRVVEWNAPNPRESNGRSIRRTSDTEGGETWDAIEFKNPFKNPITTGPIEIVDGENFLGQSSIEWVNPQQEKLLRITKAVTVIGSVKEEEIAREDYKNEKGEWVYIDGNHYIKQTVAATLTLRNYRKTDAITIAKITIHGNIIDADDNPEKCILSGRNANTENVLKWRVTAPAKGNDSYGEKVITVKYTVLVRQ